MKDSITHWSIPNRRLDLEKITKDRYYFKVFFGESLIYPISEEFNFQIHIEDDLKLIGLYVFSKNRGWYLATESYFPDSIFEDIIVKMYNQRSEMMAKIYATHQAN